MYSFNSLSLDLDYNHFFSSFTSLIIAPKITELCLLCELKLLRNQDWFSFSEKKGIPCNENIFNWVLARMFNILASY